MKHLKSFFKNKKFLYGVAAFVIILFAVLFIAKLVTAKEGKQYEKKEYATETENQLADKVREFIGEYVVVLSDKQKDIIADEAVNSYNKVITSGVESVTDDHTAAIANNIRSRLSELTLKEPLPSDDVDYLTYGISQIVWEFLLEKITVASSSLEEDPEMEEQYITLSDSLQKQIDELKDRNMKFSITANIEQKGIDQETLEETKSELYESYGSDLDTAMSDIYSEMDSMKSELEKEMDKEINSIKSSVKDGEDGKDGKAGNDGKTGKDGKNGKDGKDGEDGKTSYIRYATDETGSNMSEFPTEQTKYIGTYVGTTPSTNPADYTWTKYKDAVITYDESTNTLMITQ